MNIFRRFSSKIIVSTVLTSLVPLGFISAVNLSICYDFIIKEYSTDAEKASFLTEQLIQSQISIFLISLFFAGIFSLSVSRIAIKPIFKLTKQVSKVRESLDDVDGFKFLPDSNYKEFSILSATINDLLKYSLEYESKNKSLKEESIIDGLTGLYNRKHFNSFIHEIDLNNSSLVSVLFIDIDRFKKINDTYGHSVGDRVLNVVSKVILDVMCDNVEPDNFRAFRYGGEEIIVILKNKSKSQSFNLAEKIRLSIENSNDLHKIIKEYYVTASLGVSHHPTHADTIQELIDCADIALYKSKNTGRNKTTLHSK